MEWSIGSEAVTRGVRVSVRTVFLADHSDPANDYWMYAYEVTLTNEGSEMVQLLRRHWIITNFHGVEEHVRGPGVVGETPRIAPGQSYVYTSGCPIETVVGTMHGSFQMVTASGEEFDAEVAPFTLAQPYAVN